MDIFEISKSIFYIFWDKCMQLGSHVLGTKTELLIEPIFDLGLRSGNIEFWNLVLFIFDDFWKGGHFQNSIFPLLRPKSKIGSIKSSVLVPRT